jgi:hypothetical protein
MFNVKSILVSVLLLALGSQAIAEAEEAEAKVSCLYLSNPASCSIEFSLPMGSRYEVQQYDLNSLSWMTATTLKNKEGTIVDGLEHGALYRVLSHRGDSGYVSSNMVWLPLFVATWEELPDNVPVINAEGQYDYCVVSKNGFFGDRNPLGLLNVQYNLCLFETYYAAWEGRADIYQDLPDVVKEYEGELTPENLSGILNSAMVPMYATHKLSVVDPEAFQAQLDAEAAGD